MTATSVDPRQLHRLCHRSMEFRAADDAPTDGFTLTGYAAVFDAPTTIESWEGSFEEVVKRGAFRRTLGQRTPVMQFDHGNDKRTGTTPIGSIEDIREDSQGLFVRARVFDNDLVLPIRQAVASQAIRGMSFKFRVMDDQWLDAKGKRLSGEELADLMDDPGDRGPLRREITEVDLFELGPVVFPAYDQTSVGVRSQFDVNAVALRGVIAQFGLEPRCIQRHLQLFDDEARRALAREIVAAFPELAVALRGAAEPGTAPAAESSPETSPEPAADDGTSEPTADPAPARHSAYPWEPAADWYLPDPQIGTYQ